MFTWTGSRPNIYPAYQSRSVCQSCHVVDLHRTFWNDNFRDQTSKGQRFKLRDRSSECQHVRIWGYEDMRIRGYENVGNVGCVGTMRCVFTKCCWHSDRSRVGGEWTLNTPQSAVLSSVVITIVLCWLTSDFFRSPGLPFRLIFLAAGNLIRQQAGIVFLYFWVKTSSYIVVHPRGCRFSLVKEQSISNRKRKRQELFLHLERKRGRKKEVYLPNRWKDTNVLV